MVALQHTPSLQRPAAAAQAQQQPQAAPRQLQASRRAALGAALLLPAAAVALPLPPALAAEVAADAAAAASALAGGAPTPEALDVVSWPQWVDRNFSFAYPPGLREAPSSAFEQPLPRNAADQPGENPLKAAVRSEDGQQRIDVVVRQATALKRTLFQVTDISQLGDERAVAKLLLPPGATVLGIESVAVAQPPKDTGTVLGVIERDPVNYFSYEVLLPDRSHLQLTAAAQLGRLYVLAASAPDEQWGASGAALKQAALTFRLNYRN
ncbi:hypothetical protein COHA_008243 [Chlorella ohadii]|uniref:PsbP C-terminal domain-containing protein n=1 Tax=Chlorella ohadii TaxID=2649997 RepID=A0AAD5H3E1_9CHLO|nr:hypothetical protein COHA_008243 [Chlorella ohadii]